jgi:POT family proton-dependent oligopeptide transporter
MSEVAAKQSHPKGLWVLFGTEMWEELIMVGAMLLQQQE